MRESEDTVGGSLTTQQPPSSDATDCFTACALCTHATRTTGMYAVPSRQNNAAQAGARVALRAKHAGRGQS